MGQVLSLQGTEIEKGLAMQIYVFYRSTIPIFAGSADAPLHKNNNNQNGLIDPFGLDLLNHFSHITNWPSLLAHPDGSHIHREEVWIWLYSEPRRSGSSLEQGGFYLTRRGFT